MVSPTGAKRNVKGRTKTTPGGREALFALHTGLYERGYNENPDASLTKNGEESGLPRHKGRGGKVHTSCHCAWGNVPPVLRKSLIVTKSSTPGIHDYRSGGGIPRKSGGPYLDDRYSRRKKIAAQRMVTGGTCRKNRFLLCPIRQLPSTRSHRSQDLLLGGGKTDLNTIH